MEISDSLILKIAESRRFERFLEVLPGFLVWVTFIIPFLLAPTFPFILAYFIIIFDLFWLFRALNISKNTILGYQRLKKAEATDWLFMCKKIANLKEFLGELNQKSQKLQQRHPFLVKNRFLYPTVRFKNKKIIKEYLRLQEKIKEVELFLKKKSSILNWEDIHHIYILPSYKENLEVLEDSIRTLSNSAYPKAKITVVFAGEGRISKNKSYGEYLKKKYSHLFFSFYSIIHPDNLPSEGKVKGANTSYAAKIVAADFRRKKIPPESIIVTSSDADVKVHPQFFACLTYNYITNPNRLRRSFQPIPMFFNNIWDAPAPTRISATSCSFWQMVESVRVWRLRNFSTHSMSLKTLIEVDFWDRHSIVEDGKQYWRAFFAFDGDYAVVPVWIPVYNDAVLAKTLWKTLKAQYKQLRRWAYGVSDFPYIVINSIRNKNISLGYRLLQTFRQFEGNFNWATAPLVIAFVGWLPIILNPNFRNQLLAQNLPIIASKILTLAAIGMVVSMWISVILLPPRPKKYGKRRHFAMVLQWLLVPFITIFFGALPAIDAQTRLMIGKYLAWQTTIKIRIKRGK